MYNDKKEKILLQNQIKQKYIKYGLSKIKI